MYVKDKESFKYVSINNKNAIRLVQQQKENNGIVAYVDKSQLPEKFKTKIEKAGQITINPDQPLSFYQEDEFIGNSVIIIDTSELSKNVCLYLVGEIQRIRRNSTWNDKFPKEQVKQAEISLPYKKGKIDFDFMSSLISELEEERISELSAYLKVSGLDNYELSSEDEKLLNKNVTMKDFSIVDEIFNVNNTHNILSSWIKPNSGSTPYVTAGESNNSVSTYIDYDNTQIEKGNSIMIGGKTLVITYQENDYFSNDSHNLALYLKDENKVSENVMLYMVAALYKSLKPIYSWGDSISGKKIKKDIISLPVKEDNTIDYEYMERYIEIVKKISIKNVVIWKDKIISKTKEII